MSRSTAKTLNLGAALKRIDGIATNDISELHQALMAGEHLGVIFGGERPSQYAGSPVLWNRYFEIARVHGRFLPLDVPHAGSVPRLIDLLAGLPQVVDITVTNPYKRVAADVLISTTDLRDSSPRAFTVEIENAVRLTRVVNHLILDESWMPPSDGRQLKPPLHRIALNTDGVGMARAVAARSPLRDRQTLIVGGGGAAISIAFALARHGARLTVASAFPQETVHLVEAINSAAVSSRPVEASEFSLLADYLPRADIVVDAVTTGFPVAMLSNVELKPRLLIAETKYGRNADLRSFAERYGYTYVDGWDMLFEQFRDTVARLYRGLRVPEATHRAALHDVARSCKPP